MDVEDIKIGTPVIYWGIITNDGKMLNPFKSEIKSSPWRVGDIMICKIKGKSGGVAISHLDEITPGSLMAAKLRGLDISDLDLENISNQYFKNRGLNVDVKITKAK